MGYGVSIALFDATFRPLSYRGNFWKHFRSRDPLFKVFFGMRWSIDDVMKINGFIAAKQKANIILSNHSAKTYLINIWNLPY